MTLWTKDFYSKYHDRLETADVIADCLATALQVHSDNAAIESKHAHIRRRVLVASCQTHLAKLSGVSSDFVQQQTFSKIPPKLQTEAQQQTPTAIEHREEPPQKKSKTTPGGGACRAFIHEKCAGGAKADFGVLAAEYNKVSSA